MQHPIKSWIKSCLYLKMKAWCIAGFFIPKSAHANRSVQFIELGPLEKNSYNKLIIMCPSKPPLIQNFVLFEWLRMYFNSHDHIVFFFIHFISLNHFPIKVALEACFAKRHYKTHFFRYSHVASSQITVSSRIWKLRKLFHIVRQARKRFDIHLTLISDGLLNR